MKPEKPILNGSTIRLRPIVLGDAPGMFASMEDGESMRLTGTQSTFTLEQVEQHCARLLDADDRCDYAITLRSSGAYLGEVVLNQIDWVNRTAGFRICLAGAAHFGKGYGSEATQLLLAHGFQTLQLHRIELEVYDFNPRAIHVYEKAGFVREGERREVLLCEGEYHDAITMSMLAREHQQRVSSSPS